MAKEDYLAELKKLAQKCKRCRLHETRTNVVFGDGNADAKVIFVGEACGRSEDKLGHVFVGPAGKILDTFLELAGIKRADVYICNVLKCRPPGNRVPLPDEIMACSEYLKKQIEIINPQLIVALGSTAGKTLIGRKVSITEEHGQIFDCKFGDWSGKVMLTFHPAAIIYNKRLKESMDEDFRKLGEIVASFLD